MKIVKLLVVLVVLMGVGFFLRSSFWKVRRIDCKYNGSFCPSEIWMEITDLSFRKNTLFFSKRKTEEEILKKFPTLKQVKIKKVFPNKLIYEIEIRKGVVALNFEEKQESVIVDEEGVVIGEEKNTSLPIIFLKDNGEMKIGEKTSKTEVLKAINLLIQLRLNLFKPKLANFVSSRWLEVYLAEDVLCLFSLEKEESSQLASLQFILSRSKIEGRRIKKIDLRFEKPVVTYE